MMKALAQAGKERLRNADAMAALARGVAERHPTWDEASVEDMAQAWATTGTGIDLPVTYTVSNVGNATTYTNAAMLK